MRFLLIIYDNEQYTTWFSQGLAYITSVIRNKGHDVVIYNQDINHNKDEEITKYLNENYFDFVGLSMIGGYFQYKKALSISNAINNSKHRQDFYFSIGGHLFTPEPEYFLKKTQADILFMGESEETIAELIDDNFYNLKNIKGIAYREREEVYINERRELIKDIDSIPWPAYDLFPINNYRLLRMPNCNDTDFIMPLLSGRGCHFKCNFCYRLDKGFRPRSNQSIIDEMKFLRDKYGITYIVFSDELLMSSKNRVKSLCEDFLFQEVNMKWSCNGRLNYASKDTLSLMKRAGCVFVNYGIEAFDDQVLKNMKKSLNCKQIEEGVKNTLEVGISPGLNILWGNLGDTINTLYKGVNFLRKYDDYAQMRTIRPVTPYPGSPLYYEAINRGLLKGVEDFYENKHINSDLISVNFTLYTDEECHSLLEEANNMLIREYFKNKQKKVLANCYDLYYNKNIAFRGFR